MSSNKEKILGAFKSQVIEFLNQLVSWTTSPPKELLNARVHIQNINPSALMVDFIQHTNKEDNEYCQNRDMSLFTNNRPMFGEQTYTIFQFINKMSHSVPETDRSKIWVFMSFFLDCKARFVKDEKLDRLAGQFKRQVTQFLAQLQKLPGRPPDELSTNLALIGVVPERKLLSEFFNRVNKTLLQQIKERDEGVFANHNMFTELNAPIIQYLQREWKNVSASNREQIWQINDVFAKCAEVYSKLTGKSIAE